MGGLAAIAAAEPATLEERGDAAFQQRAAGYSLNGIPDPGPIAEAIAAYEAALAADPDNLKLQYKLMDALYFQGFYVVSAKKEKRKVFDRLLEMSDRMLGQVRALTGRAATLIELPPEEQVAILKGVPEAADAYFWQAAGWGLWGMTHSPLAAARKGVVNKVRDNARMVILIDEAHDEGGGMRILGRLHTLTPKIPLITDWIDRTEGLTLLRRAVEISRREPRNLLFLAEGILRYEKKNRAEAVELLRELDRRTPDPGELVEESEILKLARELLAKIERAT